MIQTDTYSQGDTTHSPDSMEQSLPGLAAVLSNRIAINILKILYDNEMSSKSMYTLNLSNIQQILVLVEKPLKPVMLLAASELVTTDAVENEVVMSITAKGKEFIELFDQLKEVYEGEKRPMPSKPQITYDLTTQEKRVLALTQMISQGTGMQSIDVQTLAQELFPTQYKRKMSIVMRNVNKLSELNLLHLHEDESEEKAEETKAKKGKKKSKASKTKKAKKKKLVKVSDKGARTIKDQYLHRMV